MRPIAGACAALLCGLSAPAHAQDADGRTLTITPKLTVQTTLTNNRDLVATDPQADLVTEVSPGVQVSSQSGRVQGLLDYSLDGFFYARGSSRNVVQNTLSASGKAELIENHAFVTVIANVARQAISAYGTQVVDNGLPNNNLTQVSSLQVTPTLRGSIGDYADVLASSSWSASRSQGTPTGDNNGLNSSIDFSHRTGLLGWDLNLGRQSTSFEAGGSNYVDQAVAALNIYPDYDLKLTLRGGEQITNAETGSRQSSGTWGAGVDWQPTDRTDIVLNADHQYFGNSHTVSLSHRMEHSVWTYSDTRGVSAPSLSSAVPTNPLAALYNALLAIANATYPNNPVLAQQAAQAALQAQGYSLSQIGAAGFLSSQLTLQHTRTFSVVLNGLRDSISLSGLRSDTQQFGNSTATSGDIAQFGIVSQIGLTLGISHRLTPDSSLLLNLSRQATLDAPGQPGNSLHNLSLTWFGALSRSLGATLGARRVLSIGGSTAYNESAVFGSLGLKF